MAPPSVVLVPHVAHASLYPSLNIIRTPLRTNCIELKNGMVVEVLSRLIYIICDFSIFLYKYFILSIMV